MVADFFENIKRALLSFSGIVDLLDVVLVAFVIYSAIKLIRGTRAFQLAKGVVVLAGLYAIVTLLEMRASEFILSFVFTNLLIILVVIFAPELRHALETMGRSSSTISNILNFKNKDETEIQENIKNSINSVCKACADMSDKQVGALIVFEKDSLLGEISKTGTSIDAVVTTEIIENIFFPKAPMHDGAIIIKDGRVTSAGCILPLTNNLLSRELGTRHRAAVGMSESSDAIVVVVSEETGSISVAERGNLKRGISDGDLREILMKNFIKEDDKETSKIKKILRGNKNEK
ncbi:MAG: diadenylate cyclase CdaA [Clostridia bacterium]|nr:diadenylate cyclase CdaA [Clostridia bacterium]